MHLGFSDNLLDVNVFEIIDKITSFLDTLEGRSFVGLGEFFLEGLVGDALIRKKLSPYHSGLVVHVGKLELQDLFLILVEMSGIAVGVISNFLKGILKFTDVTSGRSDFIVDELS